MRTILKILIMLVGVFSYAQTTVSGSITDQNNQPLSGATVIVVGTSNGVAADFDGNYSITVDMDAPFSIEVSSVGFKANTVEVLGTSTVNICFRLLSEVSKSASKVDLTFKLGIQGFGFSSNLSRITNLLRVTEKIGQARYNASRSPTQPMYHPLPLN